MIAETGSSWWGVKQGTWWTSPEWVCVLISAEHRTAADQAEVDALNMTCLKAGTLTQEQAATLRRDGEVIVYANYRIKFGKR